MFQHLLFTVSFLAVTLSYGQSSKADLFRDKKVEHLPIVYETPTNPLSTNPGKSNTIWIVYSDRNDNNIYSDVTASKVTSKVGFLDSFYVIKVSNDMFELIKYNPTIITHSGKISEADKIEYVGWINKSNLLLNENSFVEAVSKYPYKYVTLINGTNIFPNTLNYYNGRTIKIYSDPDLKNLYGNYSLRLNEIIYVYKKYKDQVLIGNESHFNSRCVKHKIIGWVHTNFIQQWSSRLNIEINTSENSDTIASYLFPAKNHAINFENNISSAIPLKTNECQTTENIWKKNPVYSIENISKNNQNYLLMETGVIIKPFDNSQAYVYSSSGSKINYPMLCSIIEESKKNNIIFVLNLDNDLKEYYTNLIETFQEIDEYFSLPQKGTYTFSLINSSDNSFSKIITTNNFNQLLSKTIDLIKENVQLKKQVSPNGILNGLTAAHSYFKNHPKENNILISFSTKGDYNTDDNIYKNNLNNVIANLSSCNVKVIMYQPYSNIGGGYVNFIPQSKYILKKYAEKSIHTKSSLQVAKNEDAYLNTFKSIETNLANIYCLDFPKNAAAQGFIVFPTIGSKVDKKAISTTLDSAYYQLEYDKNNTINNILESFNSSSIFNTKVNPYFERYYNMFKTLPRNLELECKNVNFDYFARGYIIYPYDLLETQKNYSQNLLLTEEEYQDLCSLFKSLQIDVLLTEPSEENKKNTQNILRTTFNKRTFITKRNYTQPTLKDFLFETCGYQTYTHLLNKCLINDFSHQSLITKDEYFTLLTRLKHSFDSFYLIQDNPNYSFYSNGVKYYWINESLLP